MPPRKSFRPGSYLIEDSLTGFVHHSKDIIRQWDGLYAHRRSASKRHPDWHFRVRKVDERAPDVVRKPRALSKGAYSNAFTTAFDALSPVNSRDII